MNGVRNYIPFFTDVFGFENGVDHTVKAIVYSFFEEHERRSVDNPRHPFYDAFPPPIRRFVNLVTLELLVDPRYLEQARKVARSIYEMPLRPVQNPSHGSQFPMYPELLFYAMQLAKGETVVELGGASGENGLLLAHAGAKAVYVNDIDHQEMVRFRKARQEQPASLKEALHGVEGNCLTFLKKQPQLEKRVGFLLCSNLIHFFTVQEHDPFFEMVNRLLKPGGFALFIANSVYSLYSHQGHRELLEENPQATTFLSTVCHLWEKNGTLHELLRTIDIADQDVNLDERACLSTKKPGSNWAHDQKKFKQLGKLDREDIREALLHYSETLKSVTAGEILFLKHVHRNYNARTFTELFKRRGFSVEHLFLTGDNGHIHSIGNPSIGQLPLGNGLYGSIGVIIRAPDAPVAAAAAAAAPIAS